MGILISTGFVYLIPLLASVTRHASILDLSEAVERYEHGAYREAAELLVRKCHEAPDDTELRLWLGKCYLKTQQWDEAVSEMEKAVQAQPSTGLYHLWLGRA